MGESTILIALGVGGKDVPLLHFVRWEARFRIVVCRE